MHGVCVCLQATSTQCCLQLKDDAKFRSLSKRDLSNYSRIYEIVDPSQAKAPALDSYHMLYRWELSHLAHFHTTFYRSVVIVHEKNLSLAFTSVFIIQIANLREWNTKANWQSACVFSVFLAFPVPLES